MQQKTGYIDRCADNCISLRFCKQDFFNLLYSGSNNEVYAGCFLRVCIKCYRQVNTPVYKNLLRLLTK